jgi:hypothetical protein
LFLVIAITGILCWPFPQDPRDGETTVLGTIHLILAGILSLCTFVTALLFFFGLRHSDHKKLMWFALVSFFVILITGIITIVGLQTKVEFFGVLERFTIGSYEIWVLALSSVLLYENVHSNQKEEEKHNQQNKFNIFRFLLEKLGIKRKSYTFREEQ